jgi:pre-mRNA cleavage complex 2 protein Pcf11
LNDSVSDVKGKRRAAGSRLTARVAIAEEVAHRDAELRAMTVVVPPGDEAKSISCPICKETLKTEFNEDDEEWVWQNAVQKDDKVCILP